MKKDSEDHLCFDGKAVRGNKCPAKGIKPIQIVSAWSESQGLSMAEVTVNKKSNEITAIPMLIDLLDIKDSTISIDAMGTQKDIAEKNKAGRWALCFST